MFLIRLVLFVFIVSVSHSAFACSCMPGIERYDVAHDFIKARYDKADYVFLGRVVDMEDQEEQGAGVFQVSIDVMRGWKDVRQGEVFVFTSVHEDGFSCKGREFSRDITYLIMLDARKHIASFCEGNVRALTSRDHDDRVTAYLDQLVAK